MTQNEIIIAAMKSGWVSPFDASRLCGTLRFSGRILEIKALGYNLDERWGSNEHSRWKEFRMKRNEEPNGQGVML